MINSKQIVNKILGKGVVVKDKKSKNSEDNIDYDRRHGIPAGYVENSDEEYPEGMNTRSSRYDYDQDKRIKLITERRNFR